MDKLDYNKYKCLKIGQMLSVGMIDSQYVFEILTGPFSVPEYYPINREEFDSFDNWKEDTGFIVGEVKNRECVTVAHTKIYKM